MINGLQRNVIRQRVHSRIRAKMEGTATRPRLNVYRSLNHIYTQLIDDANGVTIVSASTMSPKGTERKAGGNVEAAKMVGKLIAERACITAASRRWLMLHVKLGSSSKERMRRSITAA
jgi:large subunit ribosomal protein L18